MRRMAWGSVLALASVAAGAHAHLEKAQPASDGKNAVVEDIRLHFSEEIEPRLSSIRLETTEERAITEPAAEVDAADPKVLAVHLYEKLPPGNYRVRWAVVAKDGHRTAGTYTFLVSR
jgi:methionine-rich copper-binding protein CopC